LYLSDQEILNYFKIKGQEEYAFNQLLRKYQERVYWQVRRMVVDHDDANDITQDIFVKVWKKIREFREESQLFTWIYRIAVNESLNFLKKQKKKAYLSLTNYENILSKKIDTSSDFTGDEIQKRLHKAILKLPEKQRIVFNFRYFEEKPYEEISEILQTSTGALKASFHHAVKKIEKFVFYDD